MSTVYSPLVTDDHIGSDANGISIHEYSSEPAEEAEESMPVYHRAVSKDHEADLLIDQRELSIDGTQVRDPHTAGIFGSYVNLTNSIIGSGCLGLPYAFAGSGWGLGFFLIIISACFTVFSLHLLSICSLKVRAPASFYRITEASVPQMTFLVDLSVATMCFGVGVSYLIVIGGLMPAVTEFLGGSGMWLHREIWILLGFLVVAPISCFKTLDALKWTSALAIFFVMFIAGLVFTYAVDETLARCSDDAAADHDGCIGGSSNAVVNVNTLRVFGVFVFAYSCQMNIFPVVNELKRPTIKRFNIVIYISIATAVALYCVVAGAGYATYGDAVESNILINYPNTQTTSVARIFVSFLVAFSYPLLCNPGRNSMISLWANFIDGKTEDDLEVSAGHGQGNSIAVNAKLARAADKERLKREAKLYDFRFAVCTGIFVFGSLGLALVLDDLGVVLALIGATGSTVITFILPGAAYYVMHKDSGPAWKRNGAILLFCLGCVIMPVCVTFIFV